MEKVITNLSPVGFESPIEHTYEGYVVSGSIHTDGNKKLTSADGNIARNDGTPAGRFSVNGTRADGPMGSIKRNISLNDVPIEYANDVNEAVQDTVSHILAELAESAEE